MSTILYRIGLYQLQYRPLVRLQYRPLVRLQAPDLAAADDSMQDGFVAVHSARPGYRDRPENQITAATSISEVEVRSQVMLAFSALSAVLSPLS